MKRKCITEDASLQGTGGHGCVYKKHILEYGNVALKKSKRTSSKHGVPADCVREIAILRHVAHDRVQAIYDVVASDELPVIVMPCAHRPLNEYVGFKFVDAELCRVHDDLVGALDHLHGHGILHRDIKPSNILVYKTSSDERYFTLADFGSATMMTEEWNKCLDARYTTYAYSPPELLCTDKYVYYDTDIDMWGLGVVLAELCAEHFFFHGKDEGTVLQRIQERHDEARDALRAEWQYMLDLVPKNRRRHPRRLFSWRYVHLRDDGVWASEHVRTRTLEWMALMGSDFRFLGITVHLAVTLMDRFIHTIGPCVGKESRDDVVRLGLAVLALSAKLVDVQQPYTHDLIRKSAASLTTQDVTRMEMELLVEGKDLIGTLLHPMDMPYEVCKVCAEAASAPSAEAASAPSAEAASAPSAEAASAPSAEAASAPSAKK